MQAFLHARIAFVWSKREDEGEKQNRSVPKLKTFIQIKKKKKKEGATLQILLKSN